MKNYIKKAMIYLKGNHGSDFILLFMVLLVCSTILLIFKKEDIAEKLANYGYVLLIIGVILKFIEFNKLYKKKG